MHCFVSLLLDSRNRLGKVTTNFRCRGRWKWSMYGVNIGARTKSPRTLQRGADYQRVACRTFVEATRRHFASHSRSFLLLRLLHPPVYHQLRRVYPHAATRYPDVVLGRGLKSISGQLLQRLPLAQSPYGPADWRARLPPESYTVRRLEDAPFVLASPRQNP